MASNELDIVTGYGIEDFFGFYLPPRFYDDICFSMTHAEILEIVNRFAVLYELDTYSLGIHPLGVCDITVDPPLMGLSPQCTQSQIANLMGRIFLSKRVDLCLGTPMFRYPGYHTEQSVLFYRRTTTAQGFSDLWMDDSNIEVDPGLLLQLIHQNKCCLNEIAQSDDAWFDPDEVVMGAILQAVALCETALDRLSAPPDGTFGAVMRKIEVDIEASLGVSGVEKLHRLVALYCDLPELPEERFEAVRLLESVTQEAAKILGFTIPKLVYSDEADLHYWTE